MKTPLITLELIESFGPCYHIDEYGFTKDLKLSPIEWIDQWRDKVRSKKDIYWVLLRKEFMPDKDLRLFAVWCARGALKLIDNPDERSINACNVAERYANGEASEEEIIDAAAYAAAAYAAAAAYDVQIDKLRDYFITGKIY